MSKLLFSILFLSLMSLSTSSFASGGTHGETDPAILDATVSEGGAPAIDDPFGMCCSDREQAAMSCVNGAGTESPGKGPCADKMAAVAGVVGSSGTSTTKDSGNEE